MVRTRNFSLPGAELGVPIQIQVQILKTLLPIYEFRPIYRFLYRKTGYYYEGSNVFELSILTALNNRF